jgi:biopolymer transport protein ExbB
MKIRRENKTWRQVATLTLALLAVMCVTAFAQDPAGPAATQKETMWSLTKKGGPVMYPLALGSILGLAITLERLISLRRDRVIPAGFVEQVRERWEQDKSGATAIGYCAETSGPMGRIFKVGLMNRHRGEEAVEKAMEDTGFNEIDKLKRSIRPLSYIAALSPLLGLLGTVYGLIDAFQVAAGGGMGKADLLAQGIYEALVTTAAGLTIAIPILVAYQYLGHRVDALVDEMDEMGVEFMHTCVYAKQPVNSAPVTEK